MEEQTKHSRTEKISYADKGRFFKLRNILNTVFILLAAAGMAIYFLAPAWTERACWPMLILAVIIKMTECVLRYIR